MRRVDQVPVLGERETSTPGAHEVVDAIHDRTRLAMEPPASRVEGLNKELGTTILITGETLSAVSEQVDVKDRGLMPVKGRVQPVHVFELSEGAAATSGIGRRSWLGPDGRPAHHLLDPATGRPAFTGVVQATALAPTAVEAEWRAKAAVLSGPGDAGDWLEHGGVVVLDDGTHHITEGVRHEQTCS